MVYIAFTFFVKFFRCRNKNRHVLWDKLNFRTYNNNNYYSPHPSKHNDAKNDYGNDDSTNSGQDCSWIHTATEDDHSDDDDVRRNWVWGCNQREEHGHCQCGGRHWDRHKYWRTLVDAKTQLWKEWPQCAQYASRPYQPETERSQVWTFKLAILIRRIHRNFFSIVKFPLQFKNLFWMSCKRTFLCSAGEYTPYSFPFIFSFKKSAYFRAGGVLSNSKYVSNSALQGFLLPHTVPIRSPALQPTFIKPPKTKVSVVSEIPNGLMTRTVLDYKVLTLPW